jgi:endo-1,4-beta-xylanase
MFSKFFDTIITKNEIIICHPTTAYVSIDNMDVLPVSSRCLTGATLVNRDLVGYELRNCKLRHCTLLRCNVINCELVHVDIMYGSIGESSMIFADLREALLLNCEVMFYTSHNVTMQGCRCWKQKGENTTYVNSETVKWGFDRFTKGQLTLRDLAKRTHKLVGVAISTSAIHNTNMRQRLNEFDAVVAENAMKWQEMEPRKGSVVWADADAIVSMGDNERMTVHGHTLIWGKDEYLPEWTLKLHSNDFRDAFMARCSAPVKRYQGRVSSWDVLNEIVADEGEAMTNQGLRCNLLTAHLGSSWVEDALRTAHAADPTAHLFINDYNLEWGVNNGKTQRMLALVSDLQNKGVPLDGVGLQCHFDSAKWPGIEDLKKVIDAFAALGLRVRISELDVKATDDPTQAAHVFYDVVRAAVESNACDGVLVWGMSCKDSWNGPNTNSLLFDAEHANMPAYYAVRDALRDAI